MNITEKIKNNNIVFIKCKDYTVSNEEFQINKSNEYDLLYTENLPDDLGKYYESEAYISHTDSNKTLIDKVYKLVRNFTLNSKVRLITKHNTGSKNLLDIGSGTGDFLIKAKSKGWTVDGVEPNEKARVISSTKNLVINKSIDNIENKRYSTITMWHVLEHVVTIDEYIEKIDKLLDDNGTLIVAVPNYKSYDAKYYKKYWAAYDVPRHVWHFSKTSIEKIFNEFNFELVKTKPMLFDSFYVSMLSEKYKTGKNNYIKAFVIGLLSNCKAYFSKEYSSHIYVLKKKNN
ncbi:class I SAM-dependent methyltransferase [Tenacibaculum geojense]|uniref:Class I SAM-dependent methyltransferase n=1 Tax=Tenacibaculum geojense TaxID=915352 RepID=A0ABW3JP36_9FLAO